MTLKRKHEDSFYGHGKTWFRRQMIGKEKYGSVYLATVKKPKWRLITNFPIDMAVKSKEISDSGLLQMERMVLESLQDCPYIRQLLGEEITTGDGGEKVYNLLLEYCCGGTLSNLIKQLGGAALPESDVGRYARDILLGLKYIHEYGYVYGDLKPENILLVPDTTCSTSNNPKYIAKIGDLGFIRRAKQTTERKSDIRAFGCVVIEMLSTGKPMWDRKKGSDGLPEIPSGISKEGKDFLKGCLDRENVPILGAEMLLNHPFVAPLEEVDNECNDCNFIPVEVEQLQEVDNKISSSFLSDDWDFIPLDIEDAPEDSNAMAGYANDEELIIPCFSNSWRRDV